MACFFGLGLLVSLLMKNIPMHTVTDENWGFEEKKKGEVKEGIALETV
jgi:hypothetical protein